MDLHYGLRVIPMLTSKLTSQLASWPQRASQPVSQPARQSAGQPASQPAYQWLSFQAYYNPGLFTTEQLFGDKAAFELSKLFVRVKVRAN